jgi:hypothetical protein
MPSPYVNLQAQAQAGCAGHGTDGTAMRWRPDDHVYDYVSY